MRCWFLRDVKLQLRRGSRVCYRLLSEALFFNYTGQFQRKLRFELSIYRRDDLEDNSSSYHSAYNLLSVKIKRFLTFFVVLRLRLKTQMRKLFIWIFGTKKQDFFEKVGSTKLGSSTFSKRASSFSRYGDLEKCFFILSNIQFFFWTKKEKRIFFFWERKGLFTSEPKKKNRSWNLLLLSSFVFFKTLWV